MYQKQKAAAILLMAGIGTRLATANPKQFLMLGEKPVYRHALDTLLASRLFQQIILVCHPDWQESTQVEICASLPPEETETICIIPGGTSRQESSFLGLAACRNKPDLVLIHDAVRPFVSQKILQDNLSVASLCGAVDTCIPSADTLVYAPDKTTIASIPNRADFQRGQTPQTFWFHWIFEAHEQARIKNIANATDDCSLVASMGRPIAIVQGDQQNFKITSEFDMLLAEAFLERLQPHYLQ